MRLVREIVCLVVMLGVFGSQISLVHATGAVQDGLVVYWSFDQDTVDIQKGAVDAWSGLVAVINGDPELSPASDCKVGECFLFDGDGDYLLVEDTDPPTIDRDWTEITIEAWVFINALDDSWNRIISLDNMPTNSAVATLYYDDDDDRHNFWIKTADGATDAATDDVQEDIPVDEWLHLVGTYDGSTVRYYINGKQENQYALQAGPLKQGGLLLSIGDRSDGCNCDAIQGYVDEVRIYERALSAAEVENNFRSEGLAVESTGKLGILWGTLKTLAGR